MPDSTAVSDNRALILDQFTRQAGPFASAPGIRNERSLRLVVEATGAGPADRTLDVACGPGLLACAFAEVVEHATGIDLVPAMIAQAEARQAELGLDNVSWQVGDVTPLPFGDGSFDVVTCRYAFHHFPEPGAVLAEMARVCRPGGRVAVIDVAASPDPAKAARFNEMEVRRDPSHVRALPLDELTLAVRRRRPGRARADDLPAGVRARRAAVPVVPRSRRRGEGAGGDHRPRSTTTASAYPAGVAAAPGPIAVLSRLPATPHPRAPRGDESARAGGLDRLASSARASSPVRRLGRGMGHRDPQAHRDLLRHAADR